MLLTKPASLLFTTARSALADEGTADAHAGKTPYAN
jgi:hypothetical protein